MWHRTEAGGREPLERELEEEGTPGRGWITPQGMPVPTGCCTRGLFCSFSSRTRAKPDYTQNPRHNKPGKSRVALLEGKEEEELDPPTSPTPTPPSWWNSGLLRAPLSDACFLRAGSLCFLPSFPSSLFLSNTQITACSKLTLARAALQCLVSAPYWDPTGTQQKNKSGQHLCRVQSGSSLTSQVTLSKRPTLTKPQKPSSPITSWDFKRVEQVDICKNS